MVLVEKFCPSCGMPVDPPTDRRIRQAMDNGEEVVEKEIDGHCGCEYEREVLEL